MATEKQLKALAKARKAKAMNGVNINEVKNHEERILARIKKLHKASELIEKWISTRMQGHYKIELPQSTDKLIINKLGKNICHDIKSEGIIHGFKNHGTNGRKITKSDIPISKNDLRLIPYIMVCPSRIEIGSTDNNRTSIKFIKCISNGSIIVVEKECLNNANKYETINIWGKLSDVVNAKNSPNVHVQNVVISTSDVANIIHDAEKAIEKDEYLNK